MAIVKDIVKDVVLDVVYPIDGRGLGVPFKADLNTWHKGIDGIIFDESINNLPARVLPAIASVNLTSQLQFVDLSGVAIVSSDGDSTPTINGNNIEFTVGTCSNLLLDDGTFIPDVYSGYDTNTNNDSTVVNITIDYTKDGSLHKNQIGYSLYENIAKDKWQVPFLLTGSPKITPTVPVGYTKTRDITAGGTNHNIYDSLIDMEYGSILQNDTAGIAYTPQNDAYGLVFDGIIKKVGAASDTIIHILNTENDFSGNGYRLILKNNEGISLNTITGGSISNTLFATVASYILINTDYRFLIWRNETLNQFVTGGIGTFAVYIQGKNKAITNKIYPIPNTNEMELVDVTGGSGTNPVADNTHTISNYLVNDLDAGDQVSKINVNGKYISPYGFTVSSGAYSIIDNAKNAIFNRKNQTIWSQASLFYNEFKPFIYHITELADPRIYNKLAAEFFEALYRDIISGKVKRDGTAIIRYDEELNYENPKVGADLTKVTDYDNITDIYHI